MSRKRIPNENTALCEFLNPIIDTIENAKQQMGALTKQQAIANVECLDKACQWVEAVMLGQSAAEAKEKERLAAVAKARDS